MFEDAFTDKVKNRGKRDIVHKNVDNIMDET